MFQFSDLFKLINLRAAFEIRRKPTIAHISNDISIIMSAANEWNEWFSEFALIAAAAAVFAFVVVALWSLRGNELYKLHGLFLSATNSVFPFDQGD